ncbi:hypothetical protein LRS13_24600 [Svornostia abyssi]|uniref:Uncharacterized protein n=1 Tax=Svornostia abyssi TaxID=2898438 RepID=A0ABY5PH66_9ACTN|nr:hypothetical protein LRS13_24600 [Parviterribacteraceae bacterium J379]
MTRDVTSTARTRSRATELVPRCRRPLRIWTCSGVTRYSVVIQRTTPIATAATVARRP